MTIVVQRDAFDADSGFQYYVSFKPLPVSQDNHEVHARVPVQASLSITETGDLTDISFVLPKLCRSEQALTFIRRQAEARITPPTVFVAVPGLSADAAATAVASLELDLAGRIVGMEIHWMPDIDDLDAAN